MKALETRGELARELVPLVFCPEGKCKALPEMGPIERYTEYVKRRTWLGECFKLAVSEGEKAVIAGLMDYYKKLIRKVKDATRG